MWPVDESGVKLQYKLAQTHHVNIARMRDWRSYKRDWSVWWLHFCRSPDHSTAYTRRCRPRPVTVVRRVPFEVIHPESRCRSRRHVGRHLGVFFVSKQLASTSFRRQVLSTLLVQRWRGSSANVRLSNLLISSCFAYPWLGWVGLIDLDALYCAEVRLPVQRRSLIQALTSHGAASRWVTDNYVDRDQSVLSLSQIGNR